MVLQDVKFEFTPAMVLVLITPCSRKECECGEVLFTPGNKVSKPSHPNPTPKYHTLSLVTELCGGVNQRPVSRV